MILAADNRESEVLSMDRIFILKERKVVGKNVFKTRYS